LAIFLEETYWYRIDRNYIGISISGKGAGCDYIYKKCVDKYDYKTNKARVINEDCFCTEIGK